MSLSEAGLLPTALLPQPLEGWDYRCMPPRSPLTSFSLCSAYRKHPRLSFYDPPGLGRGMTVPVRALGLGRLMNTRDSATAHDAVCSHVTYACAHPVVSALPPWLAVSRHRSEAA